ncbi:MAG: hypothetical protein HRT38_19060 [Alteromonadaceae bacterium]|nr:hypothetical protein [Alteromonadaceae bacterium]
MFLLILAQTANSWPISNDKIDSTIQFIELESQKTQPVELESQKFTLTENDEREDLFTFPRTLRATATVFSTEIQTRPNYVLEIEFFEIPLTATLFKNLINPPVILNWYEQLSCKTSSSRISGWKDGNSYTLLPSLTTVKSII